MSETATGPTNEEIEAKERRSLIEQHFPGQPHLIDFRVSALLAHNQFSSIGQLIEIIQKATNELKKRHGIIVESVVDLKNCTLTTEQIWITSAFAK